MKLVVDMNLSPAWVPVLQAAGHDAVHWSTIGDGHAPDAQIMDWARQQGRTVFTHDLDFGTSLALTRERGPSVVQVRTQAVTTSAIGTLVVTALRQCASDLERGALVVVEESNQRVRLLTLR
jgi:predicted nuclease of predicted toxin-antitoxin system